MPSYTVGVDLHNATTTDYDNLYTKMYAAGFKRTILGSDGVEYNMLQSGYYYESYEGIEAVNQKVSRILSFLSVTSNYMVAEIIDGRWNLQAV